MICSYFVEHLCGFCFNIPGGTSLSIFFCHLVIGLRDWERLRVLKIVQNKIRLNRN